MKQRHIIITSLAICTLLLLSGCVNKGQGSLSIPTDTNAPPALPDTDASDQPPALPAESGSEDVPPAPPAPPVPPSGSSKG